MTDTDTSINFSRVSKFYGEVLGINRVNLTIPEGITSLVGPNGSGKTTLMNLLTGLIRPTRGEVRVLGLSLEHPETLFRELGYCTQYDSFPKGVTGDQFIRTTLRLHGYTRAQCDRLTGLALERVNMQEAAGRKITGYSKGMRQRIKLAQAICHEPRVLVLDEPLNGLDPMARAEVIHLFRQWAENGLHLIISSHILHEVDMISDRVVLLAGGYVVAEGDIRTVRSEMGRHPREFLVRCAEPSKLAAQLFQMDHVVEAKVEVSPDGLRIRTTDAEAFYGYLNRIVVDQQLDVEGVRPTDEDVRAVYEYLLGDEGGSA